MNACILPSRVPLLVLADPIPYPVALVAAVRQYCTVLHVWLYSVESLPFRPICMYLQRTRYKLRNPYSTPRDLQAKLF